jgi:hypothetical protein
MAMGGHVFRRSARKKRVAKHDHEYVIHDVGADLQRQVCSICGQISISATSPASLRSAPADAEPVLFQQPSLTIVVDETDAPVGLSWQFAERRSRR